MVEKKLVPPDGGWAWVIMIAYSLYNFVYIPITQNFSLIFKDVFKDLGISATDATFILTFNSAGSMLMGLVTGVLLRRFSYRKVSIVGSMLIFTGMLSTMFCRKFIHFVIAYGLISSSGVGLGRVSYTLAFNSYFLKKRSRASGFAFTLIGLGSILMPQLISYTLDEYGYKGTVLIVAGLSSHTLAAALLLQPVKWHMKEVIVEDNEKQDDKVEEVKESEQVILVNSENKGSKMNFDTSTDIGLKTHSLYDIDMPPIMRNSSTASLPASNSLNKERKLSTTTGPFRKFSLYKDSLLETNESSFSVVNENQDKFTRNPLINSVYDTNLSVKKEKNRVMRFLYRIVIFFDLTLLKDPIYVNIMVGISLAVFAELNFSLLTAFILADIGLTNPEIAMFISVTSVLDLVFRFVTPFIGDYFKATSRSMYMISLVLLIISRSAIIVSTTYKALLGVALFLGVAKGIRTVYWLLVIPDYVPIERLASAYSLQMVVNGLLILVGGVFFGLIKEITGSYVNCIYVVNSMTSLTVICWSAEMLYFKIKSTKTKKENDICT